VPEAHEFCDAVLQVWYPGCEGGRAVADVLFGDVSPSGRMPVTVPMRTEDLPAFDDYAMKGRTYRFAETEPLYPFGFGLSYSKLSYGKLEMDSRSLTAAGAVSVRTTITNKSGIAALETVQCYIEPPRSWPDAPRATLVDFKKVPVSANSSVEVQFRLPAYVFAQTDARGKRAHAPGSYNIVVGPSSSAARAIALGAPAPASAEIAIV
jgi:beta-glucosidase